MKLKFPLAFTLIFLTLILGCESNRWDVDVEKINIQQSFNRFDVELFKVAANGIDEQEVIEMQNKFQKFYPLYVEGVMGFGGYKERNTTNQLGQFTSNKYMKELWEKVVETFPEGALEEEFNAIEESFKRFHFYFPERIIPEIFTMISAFNYTTVTDDSLLAIGLDMYLGGGYSVYDQVGIPKYKSKNFKREYLVSDAMKAWLLTEFEEEGGQNLLEQMIFYGKVIYLLEVFLPQIDAHIFFNYNETELNWCEENESGIWFHFVDMELLFATENHQIRKYMGDAPFVAGFPEGSPGRVGHWVGYKIVKFFMENNKNVGLKELMEMKDANKILRQSNYKPKR